MAYHIRILSDSEHQLIHKQRLEKRREKQARAEERYTYSKDETAAILKERNLPRELKSLKRRQSCLCAALWAIGAVLVGFGGEMSRCQESDKSRAGYLGLAGGIACVASVATWCKYQRKIAYKKDEIVFAKSGVISPRIELYRQEGRVYY